MTKGRRKVTLGVWEATNAAMVEVCLNLAAGNSQAEHPKLPVSDSSRGKQKLSRCAWPRDPHAGEPKLHD